MGSAPTLIISALSFAIAGHFPSLNAQGPFKVPKMFLDATNSAEFRYPEVKWVCELLLLGAAELYGKASGFGEPLMQACSVRIEQITGPEGSRAWNESEHFPIIVRASQQLGMLPVLQGISLSLSCVNEQKSTYKIHRQSLSWLLVNRARSILTEQLFSQGFKPFYRMENPSRQLWERIMSSLSGILESTGVRQSAAQRT